MVRSQGWTQTSHPSILILLSLSLPRPIQIPQPAASHSAKMYAAGAQERNKCCRGPFFCLIEVGILSSSLLCATWVQLQWLRPLVAPVSSSAPGREDCPDLIPVLIIFKAAGI